MKNNFSRSNVNEQMLNISMPDMSAFPMSHTVTLSPKMGEILPFNVEPLLPRSVISGVNKPTLQLEKILTPSIGRVRMDTHNFVVLQNRINRDWKFFVEGKSGYENKPSFQPYSLMSAILSFLCFNSTSNSSSISSLSIPSAPYDGEHFKNFSLYPAFAADAVPTDAYAIHSAMLTSALHQYELLITTDNHFLGYNKDFFLKEKKRLSDYSKVIDELNTNSQPQPNFADVVLQILKPFFGEGSLFDMFGYPIFDQYSRAYETLKSAFTPDNNAPVDNPYYSSIADALFSSGQLYHLFTINSFNFDTSELSYVVDSYKDETFIRAYYAIWFDYFRNFHIEKRENILDPDTFDKSSRITGYIRYMLSAAASDIQSLNNFNALVNLIIPKKRNFARDYITTVQVDDIYRYVYTPWTMDNDAADQGSVDGSIATNDFYDNIQRILINEKSVYFPTSLISEVDDSYSVLRADLQTLRRTKMLERVLAREYYYPDTYAGRMQAHYGIKPGDIDAMNCVYLAGSEQFISGNQEIANVGTELTPQGTRTMVAGVSSQDPYNYAATDHAIFISTISLVPMVSYDSTNSHLDEITMQHMPLPQFASDTRCLVRPSDLLRGFEGQTQPLGYVPRYYSYRYHADETHGKYLTDYRAYNFMRDWFNMTAKAIYGIESYQEQINRNQLSLNPYFLRVNVPLDAFLGLQDWDSIAFGNVEIECQVTHPLPAAIEFI